MLSPPTMQTIPLMKTPLTPSSSPRVTKNGALIFPKLDIASEIPVPVDLIEVGNDSVVMRENKANPKVLKSLLIAIRTVSNSDLATANCMMSPIAPERTIKIIIHLFRYILSQ